MRQMKYKQILFGLLLFGVLFVWLQTQYRYHFYYIEQSQLFLFSSDYLLGKLVVPGGISAQ